MPVRYRLAGEDGWTEGIAINVSPSGVLIVGDLPVALAQPIEVVIGITPFSGRLTGCGRIARISMVGPPHAPSTFAIAVPSFSISR